MADKDAFDLKIIAPDRIFYEGKVEFVEFNTSEGERGILKNHAPETLVLEPGLVKIYEADDLTNSGSSVQSGNEKSSSVKKGVIHGGFAEILKDRVTILAEIAEWPDEIDLRRAEEAKIRAERRINTEGEGIDMDRAEASLRRALARIDSLK